MTSTTTISAHAARTLADLAATHNGIEDPERGGFIFYCGDDVLAVLKGLGASTTAVEPLLDRTVTLRSSAKGKLMLVADKADGDKRLNQWIDKKKQWLVPLRVKADQRPLEDRLSEVDSFIRYLVGQTEKGLGKIGMFTRLVSGEWIRTDDTSLVHSVLRAYDVPKDTTTIFVGLAVKNPWRLVHRPFEPEYPGGRQWNPFAPKFTIQPAQNPGLHRHWDRILNHCFADLDDVIKADEWANSVGIKSGYDYGLAWTASLFRHPFDHLPYLFFHGDQNSGKSSYHEALSLLTTGGVASADRALTNQNDFNGELANAVLAVIEERDISNSPGAYEKIKSWTTAEVFWVRKMRTDLYSVPNSLHFVQCANHRGNLPLEFGDTRIVAMFVSPFAPGEEIAKGVLMERLREEAPYFLRTLLDLPLPEPIGRFRLQPITTSSKEQMVEASVSDLARAIVEVSPKYWHGTAADLPSLLGEGHWPRDARIVQSQLDDDEQYLAKHGVTVKWGPPSKKGRAFTIKTSI